MIETPWDPNPPDTCQTCDGDGCKACDFRGYVETTIDYRPDQKIRCRVWLPHGSVDVLLWDAVEMGKLRSHIARETRGLYPTRTWGGKLFEIRPSAVTAFERIDPAPVTYSERTEA